VLRFDGEDHVAVKKPGGGFEWRTVTAGETDGASVEIKRGLQGGESVILDPTALMSEAERRARAVAPTRPAPAAGSPAGRGRQVPRGR
jgi:hypothetical protein